MCHAHAIHCDLSPTQLGMVLMLVGSRLGSVFAANIPNFLIMP
jgi:hypothetical protein